MIFGAAPPALLDPARPARHGDGRATSSTRSYRLVILAIALAAVARDLVRSSIAPPSGGWCARACRTPTWWAALGISLQPYMTAIVALALGLAGLAGVLLAPISGVHPAMGAEILTAAFVVVVIGGLRLVLGRDPGRDPRGRRARGDDLRTSRPRARRRSTS